jgi:hypothetical protein
VGGGAPCERAVRRRALQGARQGERVGTGLWRRLPGHRLPRRRRRRRGPEGVGGQWPRRRQRAGCGPRRQLRAGRRPPIRGGRGRGGSWRQRWRLRRRLRRRPRRRRRRLRGARGQGVQRHRKRRRKRRRKRHRVHGWGDGPAADTAAAATVAAAAAAAAAASAEAETFASAREWRAPAVRSRGRGEGASARRLAGGAGGAGVGGRAVRAVGWRRVPAGPAAAAGVPVWGGRGRGRGRGRRVAIAPLLAAVAKGVAARRVEVHSVHMQVEDVGRGGRAGHGCGRAGVVSAVALSNNRRGARLQARGDRLFGLARALCHLFLALLLPLQQPVRWRGGLLPLGPSPSTWIGTRRGRPGLRR